MGLLLFFKPGAPVVAPPPTLTLSDGITTYNLLSGVLKLRYGTWQMQGPTPEGETTLQGYGASYKFTGFQPITETYELYAASAATELSIRQAIVSIDKLLEQARRWHTNRSTYRDAVFLTFSTSAETARQCLVYGGSIAMLSGNGAQPTLSNNNALAQLTITRHPLWMDQDPTEIQSLVSSISTCGGFVVGLVQSGSAPALITARIYPATGGPSTALTKVWLGILDSANIARTSFNPLWAVTLGTLSATYGATSVGDVNGIGANVVQIDFDTGPHADLHERLTVSLSQIAGLTPTWDQFQGVYRILCRCRVTAATSTTVGIILKSGGATSVNLQEATEVVVANTTYSWVDLGEFTIPLETRQTAIYVQSDHMFHIFAERLAGSGDLFVDSLVLMPAEHMITVEKANIVYEENPFDHNVLVIHSDFNDALFCYQQLLLSGVQSVPEMASRDFYFPCYWGGTFVLVAERTGISVKTDVVHLQLQTYARWRSYRDT